MTWVRSNIVKVKLKICGRRKKKKKRRKYKTKSKEKEEGKEVGGRRRKARRKENVEDSLLQNSSQLHVDEGVKVRYVRHQLDY